LSDFGSERKFRAARKVRSGAPLSLVGERGETFDSSRCLAKMVMVLGCCARRALPACAFLPAISLDRLVLHFSTCSVLVASPMTDRRLHRPCGNQYLECGIGTGYLTAVGCVPQSNFLEEPLTCNRRR